MPRFEDASLVEVDAVVDTAVDGGLAEDAAPPAEDAGADAGPDSTTPQAACGDIPSGGTDFRLVYTNPYGPSANHCGTNSTEYQRQCQDGVFGPWHPDLPPDRYESCEARSDECLPGLIACKPRANCERHGDIFECECLPDHVGDACIPNECALGTHDCSVFATCTDLPEAQNGLGYRCDCKAGFEPFYTGPSRSGTCNRPASAERAIDLWSQGVAAFSLASDGGLFALLSSPNNLVDTEAVWQRAVVKYTAAGQRLWLKTFYDGVPGLVPSPGGGALVLLFRGPNEYVLHSFGAAGEPIWERTWRGNGVGLQLASHGTSTFVGGFGGAIEIDDQTLSGTFVARLDSAGMLRWARNIYAQLAGTALMVAGPSRVAWVGTVYGRVHSPSGSIFGADKATGTFAVELSDDGSVLAERYVPDLLTRAASYAGAQLIVAGEVRKLFQTVRSEIRPIFEPDGWVFDGFVQEPILAGHADGSVAIASRTCLAHLKDWGPSRCPVARLTAAGALGYAHYGNDLDYSQARPVAVLVDSLQRDVVVMGHPEPLDGYDGLRYELKFLEPPIGGP